MSPDAALAILKPGSAWVDQELLQIVSTQVRPGDVVWDIGANLGVFGAASAVQAGSSGSVLCVEADIFLASLIRQTASRLPRTCARVSVLPAAVSDAFGLAVFLIAERGRAANSLETAHHSSQMGGVRERQPVPTVTVDSLLKISPPPNFLKIDVEGAEAQLIQSAGTVLRTARPKIYIEVAGPSVEIITRTLRDAGYDLFDPSKPVEGQTPLESCLWNTLAIPR